MAFVPRRMCRSNDDDDDDNDDDMLFCLNLLERSAGSMSSKRRQAGLHGESTTTKTYS